MTEEEWKKKEEKSPKIVRKKEEKNHLGDPDSMYIVHGLAKIKIILVTGDLYVQNIPNIKIFYFST